MFEALAFELTDLPRREYAQLQVPEILLEEVELARRTRGNSSRKRQAKFLARVLRRHDAAAEQLRRQLERRHLSHRSESAMFHAIEELRDRLCTPDQADGARQEVRLRFPGLDLERLDQLVLRAHRTGDRRPRREIFRLLREAQISVEDDADRVSGDGLPGVPLGGGDNRS